MLPVGIAIEPAYDAGVTLAPSVPDTVIFPPEALMVVLPEYVFAPDNVNVPVPDFVKVPEPVVIAAIDDVPTLSTVNPMSVPVTPPDNVNDEPESTCTSDADVNKVTAPEIVCEPLVLRIAPSVDTPEPVISIGSATVKVPDSDNAALFATVVFPRVSPFLPSAVLLLIATTPAEIVVLPVYVLAFVNVNVPAADFCNAPVPETTPAKVYASLRLKVRFALFVTLPLIEPVVLPAPTESVPAVIVVPPEYVLVFVSSSAPVPSFVSIIEVPETIPLSRAVVDDATATVEFAAIVTAPDKVPAAEKFTAPADDTPVPEIVNGSVSVPDVATSSV